MKETKTSQWCSDLANCIEDSKHTHRVRKRQLAVETQKTTVLAGKKP